MGWRTSPVGMIDHAAQEAIWSIGPNPAVDRIEVRADREITSGTLQLIDGAGRAVAIIPATGNTTFIPTIGLAPGNYHVFHSNVGVANTFIGKAIIAR